MNKKTMKNFLSNLKNEIIESSTTIKTVVIVEIIFIILFSVLTHAFVIPTSSMTPTLEPGNYVIGNLVAYKNKTPQRFDIITFDYPDDEETLYCKRVIGLPGETVEINEGVTYINGEALEEDYVKNAFTTSDGEFYVPKVGDIVTVDEENNSCYINDMFVGYINNSRLDSDTNEYVKIEGFLDKYCEYTDGQYVVAKDCYFCMGDNRDGSYDSRLWQNRYVTEDKITSKIICNITKGFKSVK